MSRIRLFICAAPLMLVACASVGDRKVGDGDSNTIAALRHAQIEIKEEKIEGGLDKAILSYQRLVDETPDSALTPEAIRRLADLKIDKEYGEITTGAGSAGRAKAPPAPARET